MSWTGGPNMSSMDTKSIAAIIIRIVGLVMIVISVLQIPAYFPLTHRGYDFSVGEALATGLLALGPLALAGLLFWFFPGTITNRIVSGARAPDSSATDFRPLQLVALTVLGIYLLASGLIGVVRDVVLVIVMHRQSSGTELIPASIVAHIAATVAQLLIGAGLCIGARGISNMVERLRR